MSDGLRGNSHPKYHAYPVQHNQRLRGHTRWYKNQVRPYRGPIPVLTRRRVRPMTPNRGHWNAWFGL